MEEFKVTRIFSDENGDSCYEDNYYPLMEGGPIGFLSDHIKVKELIFRKVAPLYDYHFHNAPQKQFIILLDGEIEIETSLGVIRRFSAGDVLKVEDTIGKGHRTKNVNTEIRNSIFITY